MGSGLKKAIRWLVVAGLLIIGVRTTPEPSSTLEQPWREVIPWPWLEANWIALACFVMAAVLTAYAPIEWVLRRKFQKELRRQVRQHLTPGAFPETDVSVALHYLLRESDWGWRAYARLNFWTVVDGLHLAEFERAALVGEVQVLGFGSREGKVVQIERRLWKTLRLDPKTLDAATPNTSPYLDKPTYSDLAIPTIQLEAVWPRATALRRWRSRLWVAAKKYWYGTRLSNRLHDMRR